MLFFFSFKYGLFYRQRVYRINEKLVIKNVGYVKFVEGWRFI